MRSTVNVNAKLAHADWSCGRVKVLAFTFTLTFSLLAFGARASHVAPAFNAFLPRIQLFLKLPSPSSYFIFSNSSLQPLATTISRTHSHEYTTGQHWPTPWPTAPIEAHRLEIVTTTWASPTLPPASSTSNLSMTMIEQAAGCPSMTEE